MNSKIKTGPTVSSFEETLWRRPSRPSTCFQHHSWLGRRGLATALGHRPLCRPKAETWATQSFACLLPFRENLRGWGWGGKRESRAAPVSGEDRGPGQRGSARGFCLAEAEVPIFAVGFSGGSVGREHACNAGRPGLVPKWGRFSGEGNASSLQYSCLENRMNKGACGLQSKGSQELDTT